MPHFSCWPCVAARTLPRCPSSHWFSSSSNASDCLTAVIGSCWWSGSSDSWRPIESNRPIQMASFVYLKADCSKDGGRNWSDGPRKSSAKRIRIFSISIEFIINRSLIRDNREITLTFAFTVLIINSEMKSSSETCCQHTSNWTGTANCYPLSISSTTQPGYASSTSFDLAAADSVKDCPHSSFVRYSPHASPATYPADSFHLISSLSSQCLAAAG